MQAICSYPPQQEAGRGHLKGDTWGDDERAIRHPFLKHEHVPAAAIPHPQPALTGLRIFVGRQQVDVIRLQFLTALSFWLHQAHEVYQQALT